MNPADVAPAALPLVSALGSVVNGGLMFSLCRDNAMGIVVFELARRGNIQRVVCGEPVGTIVKDNVETRAI